MNLRMEVINRDKISTDSGVFRIKAPADFSPPRVMSWFTLENCVWNLFLSGNWCKFIVVQINGIMAQTGVAKLSQVELVKQFNGFWKSDYTIDTIAFGEAISYGTGLECNYRFVSQGKLFKEGKQLWGYDKRINKYVATSLSKGLDIEIDVYCFISANKCEALLYNDIPNPETASLKWSLEFKSPDLLIETVAEKNKPARKITYTRIK
jgi:hypothetical protein